MRRSLHGIRLVILLLVAALAQAAQADYPIGVKHMTWIDKTRSIEPAMGFAGAPERRLDVIVWYPASAAAENAPTAKRGPWPLVIYSHGTFGQPDNAMYLVRHLVSHGYVVAAPTYPMTSSVSFTKVKGPVLTDVFNQPKDISFVIDRLLADPFFAPAIDKAKIGTTGHSLGAVTSYFASFGLQTRDPRIAATAPIAAGDPVQSALSSDMGLLGTGHAAVSVPTLFLSAEKDVFARTTGRPYAAYSRIETPKYEVMIKGGVHVWFRDGDEQLPDNKNPDCLFFEKWMPGVTMPGCEERVPLIGPAKQQAITRAAVLAFFDGYLKNNAAALAALRGLGRQFPEVALRSEE
jgi:predicted dienelactone hydrolase